MGQAQFAQTAQAAKATQASQAPLSSQPQAAQSKAPQPAQAQGHFVHLHCRSGFSLFEGTARPEALVTAARRLKMPALALTDRNNLYGAVPFYIAARDAGVKPIIGMEVDLDDGTSLVLLARNMDGYGNLCHLSTVLKLNSDPEGFPPLGYDEDDEGEILPWDPGVWGVTVFGEQGRRPVTLPGKEARLPREMLLSGRHTRGLVALSGGRRGPVNALVEQGKTQAASRMAGMLLTAFGEGNFFIELTANDERERALVPKLAALASNLGIPVVAAHDVLYLSPEDESTAQALARAKMGLGRQRGGVRELGLSASGEDDLAALTRGRHMASPEEMAELFAGYPQALANARYIAEQCEVELPLHRAVFPHVGIREGETAFSKLWKLCFAGATRLYKPLTGGVIARLQHELDIIEALGFCEYFLVVQDIARFARQRDIPIMARGSAANSLVAYTLGITQVDPIAHDLLFERFLNRSRAEFELPDVDLDLCWRRRDEVLNYVYDRYGRDHVAIVGTHITFRVRSAWREMAKALGIAPDRVSRVANRLPHIASADEVLAAGLEDWDGVSEVEPEDPGPTNPKLRDDVERRAFEFARAIEGLPRHAGMHCGGVVIAPGRLADLVPLQRAARDPNMAITQYDKDAIEAMGLVKMDLLGSRALTTLVDSVVSSGLAAGRGDVHKSLATIPFDDESAYRIMAEGNTLGCFQLESPGMRGLLKWLRPRNLNDVAISISLFRPGPLEGGFLEAFMRRHLRQEPVSYHHPAMEPILRDTKGVILFQEQFLKLAHTLAGMGLGEAEKLRKDLGKSRTPEERTRLGSWFVAGAIERGIDQIQAEKVWEIIAGYSGFGFCKAHACSYALTAYRSAYMKAHYPAHYMAAMLNNQGGYYGPSVYVEDARRMGIEMLAPDVNLSGALCEVPPGPKGKRSIRMGLQFVKGLSERTISNIVHERRSGGPFRSLFDLASRVEMSPPELLSLVKVGACDSLGKGDTVDDPVEAAEAEETPANGLLSLTPEYNRKQLVWLVPALMGALRTRGRVRSRNEVAVGTHGVRLPTGTEGGSGGTMQMVMGDLMHGMEGGGAAPRILGHLQSRIEVPDLPDYTPAEKLRLEREALGFVLTRNEMELYAREAEESGAVLASDLVAHAGRDVKVAGTIVAGRRHMAKSGEWMLFASLQDSTGLIEVVLFPDAYREHGETLANGGCGPYVVRGTVQVTGKGRAIGIQPPEGLRPGDEAVLKMHPVLIAEEVRMLV